MELITFQPESALKELVERRYLECNSQYVDTERYGRVYDWIVSHMRRQIEKPTGVQYPLWCWVKFKNSICPPRHRGQTISQSDSEPKIRITFTKPPENVFITDYRRYSFLLNYRYIPESLNDQLQFEEKLGQHGLEKNADWPSYRNCPEICREIEKSFERCITSESDVLQGCVWRIYLSEVREIKFLRDPEYQYGTFNYLRKNGRRFNWIRDFYKRLQ